MVNNPCQSWNRSKPKRYMHIAYPPTTICPSTESRQPGADFVIYKYRIRTTENLNTPFHTSIQRNHLMTIMIVKFETRTHVHTITKRKEKKKPYHEIRWINTLESGNVLAHLQYEDQQGYKGSPTPIRRLHCWCRKRTNQVRMREGLHRSWTIYLR